MKKLFGGKKDKSDRGSPAPPDDNPYARQPVEDPYAKSPAPSSNSFQSNRPMGLPSGPRAGGPGGPGGPGGGLPRGPAPARTPSGSSGYSAAPPPYSGSPQPAARGPQPGPGYGNDRFGAAGGYGGNRYDNGGAPFDNKQPGSYNPPPQRQGGYGGLGGPDGDSRAGLFNDYKPPAARRNPSWQDGSGGAEQSSAADAYGGYGEQRELTEEEQQEMAVQDIKREIIDTQKATINSGQRSLQMLGSGTDSAMNIVQSLARQREHLDNAEKNIDNASVHNRIAKEQTRRLDKLNGSMFRPTGLSNKKKLAELDEQTRMSEAEEMRARDEARSGAYVGRRRLDGAMQDLQKPQQLGMSKGNKSNREKFKFEDDDGEQEQNEEEIDNITDQLAAGVSMLHGAAKVINAELEDQIGQVDRITEKSERAHDQVKRNHTYLQRAARMN